MFFIETAQDFAGHNFAENGTSAVDRLMMICMVVLLVQKLYSVDK